MNLFNRRKLIWGMVSGLIGIGGYIIYKILPYLLGILEIYGIYIPQYIFGTFLLPLYPLRVLLSPSYDLLFNFLYFFLFGILAEDLYSKKGKIGLIVTIFIYLSIVLIVSFIIIVLVYSHISG